MTQTWLDKTSDARGKLRRTGAILDELAYHCGHVGLGMAPKLHRLAIDIYDAEDELMVAIAQRIDEECRTAKAAVLNIGPVCLEVLAKKGKDQE